MLVELVNCKSATFGGAGFVTCRKDLFGGKPSSGVCANACKERDAIDPSKPAAMDAPTEVPDEGPGGLVGKILTLMGYQRQANCGCAAFAGYMNLLGWRGCWYAREEVLRWFISKAREQGLEVADDTIRSLVWSAIKDQVFKRVSLRVLP